METSLRPDDQIARCLIYPQFFEGSIHVNGKLWEFGKRADDGASHQSAVLCRLAPPPNEVHRVGCKIAKAGNDRLGDNLTAEKKRYYCGYRIAVLDSMVLVGDKYRIELRLQEELGEKAHVDVALFISTDAPRNRHAQLRTAAGIALAEAFTSIPVSHRCEVDDGDDNHPFSRLGEDCLEAGLLGPWQGKSLHLTDAAIINNIVELGGWPGLLEAPLLDKGLENPLQGSPEPSG
ncbi:hypothetical protein U1737_17170 [Sphingomonas sp. LB3N6]|uniref:hypothetical protein n=1 Tax=Sphingomonas fucosidasi TaxID=3096164 RepID=UPI002FC9BEDB